MLAKDLVDQKARSQIDLDQLSHLVFRGKDRWINMNMMTRAALDTGHGLRRRCMR